jgi:hypothetical protein
MVSIGDAVAPEVPMGIEDTGVSREVLADLLLKVACTVPQFTTEQAARQTHLPQPVVGEILEQFRIDQLLEVLGPAGPFGYRYGISQRGRDRATRLLDISTYIGPAPVSLEAYTAFLEWQLAHRAPVSAAQVRARLADLVLTSQVEDLAGLAVSSGRSLFLSGPPGNGKTSLGRLLHSAVQGDLWIPHCLNVESNIIRVFDPQIHEPAPLVTDEAWRIDQRWVRVRPPLVVVGGEAVIESFDLTYGSVLRYYEAPVHFKANGGTFLIDDFGRQRVDPRDLLNRWIIPLEHQIDYLGLRTGQKIRVPFRLLLIIATNLDLEHVTDPAFLRRMGYRVPMEPPTPALYTTIFERYAAKKDLPVPAGLLQRLLTRYQDERRELRCCEPRDLIERALDICRFKEWSPQLNDEVLNLAWIGYFGLGQAATRSS